MHLVIDLKDKTTTKGVERPGEKVTSISFSNGENVTEFEDDFFKFCPNIVYINFSNLKKLKVVNSYFVQNCKKRPYIVTNRRSNSLNLMLV